MARPRLPSLDLVLEEARSERQTQLLHFEAIDSKAGVVLGFAGALVALAPGNGDILVSVGRFLAVASGVSALASFWPRGFALTDVRVLRDKYLTSELSFTKLELVDATVAEAAQVRSVLIRKSTLLKAAMVALGMAVLCVAVGVT